MGKRGRRDISGVRSGKLVAVSPLPLSIGHYLWLCRCDCGVEISVGAGNFIRGGHRSCGCSPIRKKPRPGPHRHPLYGTWYKMLRRCSNPKEKCFPLYGGRGITVCDRWRESFFAFAKDVGKRPSPKHSIDRINNDGNYEPDNVRWATPSEQRRNYSQNRYLTLNGRTQTVTAWSEETGIRYGTLISRIRYGWCDERVLTEKVRSR